MAVLPVWRDYGVQLTQGQSCEFRVKCGSTVIYTGRAFQRPGVTYCETRINDICADYMADVARRGAVNSFPLTFQTEYRDGGDWTLTDTVSFVPDWSYDRERNWDADRNASCPINGRFDPRMPIPWTKYNADTITAVTTGTDGAETATDMKYDPWGKLSPDMAPDFSKEGPALRNTCLFRVPAGVTPASVDIAGRKFTAVSPCNRYALYYINAYGGWDALLIEGTAKRTDTLTRHTAYREYLNTAPQNRGRDNYANEIVPSLSLTTGWLSDGEAARMHHLLNSTNVNLFDITTQKTYPVVITGNSTEYKTFRSNGLRPVNYTVQVEAAQELVRR